MKASTAARIPILVASFLILAIAIIRHQVKPVGPSTVFAEEEYATVMADPTPVPPPIVPPPSPYFTVPATVTGIPNQPIRIVADSNATAAIHWKVVDPGLFLFPPEEMKTTKHAVVWGPAGVYRVWSWTVLAGEATDAAETVVTITAIGPPPIPPGPTPTPNPPAPVPTPTDPLTASLQTAYTGEASLTRASDKANLAALFNYSVGYAKNCKTAAPLFAQLHQAADLEMPGRLIATRKVCTAELRKVLATDATAINSANQNDVIACLKRIAAALEGVK